MKGFSSNISYFIFVDVHFYFDTPGNLALPHVVYFVDIYK